MSIEITPDLMLARSDTTGDTIAAATRTTIGWEVSNRADFVTYNQAITALTLAERLDQGGGDDDPFVISWREELADD